MVKAWIPTIAVLLLAAGATYAAAMQLDDQDRQFLQSVYTACHEQTDLAKLGVQKATNAEVKRLSQDLLKEHSDTGMKQFADVAAKVGYTFPKEEKVAHSAEYDRLSKLSDVQFDKEYLKALEQGHQKGASLLGNQAKNGKNADLKKFASAMRPKLQQHLAEIRALDQQLAEAAALDIGKGEEVRHDEQMGKPVPAQPESY